MLYKPKILIVDDEPRMCDSLKFILSHQGYETHTSNSGTKAIEHLSKDHFDLVLLDMVMPDLSGNSVMNYVHGRTPDTPVIVITGYGSLDSAVEAMRGGAFDYVRKPLDFDELLTSVGNAINHSILMREKEDARKKLKISERKYRYLINSYPDLVYTLDNDGKFTFINKASWSHLGYRADRLLGEHYSVVVYEGDLEKAKYYFNERRTGERASNAVELRLKSKHDGNEIELLNSGSLVVELKARGLYDRPVDLKEKKFLGTLGVARDIRYRKRLEAQLRYAQKMEAVSTFAGGMAHEFNNLLQVVLGYSELMLLGKSEGDPGYEELHQIMEAARRGGELTQRLLTFSHKAETKMTPIHLNHELKRLKDFLHSALPSSIEVQLFLAAQLYPVCADTSHLEQLLMILALNARDAMPEGGKIFIETANVTVEERYCNTHLEVRPGNYVRLTFSDTGRGMDMEAQRHIFEPFFTTKQIGHGTGGLGLAVAYGIAKIHGGYITCSSEPGAGTSFRIYLPALEPGKRLYNKGLGQGPRRSVKTILVVDDEAFMLELGKRMLNKSGYRVLTCPGGETALELYQKERARIDLVILDLVMPGMGGRRCLEQILQINPEAKVLIANDSSSNAAVQDLVEAGARGLISKPYRMSEMLPVIREALGELKRGGP